MPRKVLADELTTVAGIASTVVAHADSYGIDLEPICKALDIDPASFQDLTARISLDRLCRLLEACALLSDDEAFGVSCGRRFQAGSTGPFGYGLMSAPSGLDFVRFIDAHMEYVTNTSYSHLTFDDTGATMTWTFAPIIVKRDQYVDLSLAVLLQRARDLFGNVAEQLELHLERPKPRNLQPFRELLTRRLTFGHRMNQIQFPNSFLDRQNPRADGRLHHLMDMQCRALKPETATADADFLAQIRHYLLLHISEPDVSLEQLAPFFGLSERTFQRRLADQGTNLADLRDSIRKEVSFNLLTGSDLPISEICYRLGYSAPSAFTRSVSRWYGLTPSGLRDRKSA